MMPTTSWKETLLNKAHGYYMCGTYLSWQEVDMEPKTQRKMLFSYKDIAATKKNKSVCKHKCRPLYLNWYQKWHHPLPRPGHSYIGVAYLMRKGQ